MTEVTIIVPTYNEADCIEPLLSQTSQDLTSAPFDFDLLVVDDNSPDGTAEEVRRLSDQYDYPVSAHVRTENPGLGPSVVDGFRTAQSKRCAVMDADLQHPPSAVIDLVAELRNGADIAVGSRRADGGEFGDWSYTPHIISWGAESLARAAVPAARNVSDPMSGLFAVNRDFVPIEDLDPEGFKILLELLSVVDDATVEEVGYTFGTREEGESKLTSKEYLRFLQHLASCRARESPLGSTVNGFTRGEITTIAVLAALIGTWGLSRGGLF